MAGCPAFGHEGERNVRLADELTARPGKARYAAADLSNPAELDDLARQAETVSYITGAVIAADGGHTVI